MLAHKSDLLSRINQIQMSFYCGIFLLYFSPSSLLLAFLTAFIFYIIHSIRRLYQQLFTFSTDFSTHINPLCYIGFNRFSKNCQTRVLKFSIQEISAFILHNILIFKTFSISLPNFFWTSNSLQSFDTPSSKKASFFPLHSFFHTRNMQKRLPERQPFPVFYSAISRVA